MKARSSTRNCGVVKLAGTFSRMRRTVIPNPLHQEWTTYEANSRVSWFCRLELRSLPCARTGLGRSAFSPGLRLSLGDSADTSSLDSPVETETIRLPVVDGKDIRFARISISQGLSQVRVSDIVQDDQGVYLVRTMERPESL